MRFTERIKRLFRRHRGSPVFPQNVFNIPVLLVHFFPTRGQRVTREFTGDVDAPLEELRRHGQQTTETIIRALEDGSRYHGYKDPQAMPSLHYQVIDSLEFLEPLPTRQLHFQALPWTDYNAILSRIDIARWVETRGVKEVWLWGYHGGVVGLWESNMRGPHGDISNSNRDPRDLPEASRTYTVYHYNYQRGTSEAVEDHMHQIEAILKHVDHAMFWDRFVGKAGKWRCGWAHFPPNGEHDYDWANQRYVETDIEDWRPEGFGQRQWMNCTRWNCNSLDWFVYWMQNLPGASNNLLFRGRPLSNWWTFVGDFDGAMDAGLGL